MRRITAYIAIVLLMLTASAQAQVTTPLPQLPSWERDTTKLYQGFTVAVDLLGATQKLLSDHGQYEVGIRGNIYDKYFPAIEVGYGSADHKDEYAPEMVYTTKAPYFRVGCDYNVLKKKHDPYRLYVGGRYAFTSFNYDTTIAEASTNDQGESVITYTPLPDQKGSAHWLEFVFGVDAQVWRGLHMGWDLRYKKRITQQHGEGDEPWYIPGMGKNEGTSIWGRWLLMWEF